MSTGSRICLIVSALLLLFAAYLFWGPIGGHIMASGFAARCGSAAHPPGDTLGKAICGSVNDERRAQALTLLGAATIVAGGGLLAFGAHRGAPRDTTSAPV